MLIDLIKQNRSYRRFDETNQITSEQLLSMLEAARLSPCAANLQTLRFCICNDTLQNQILFENLRWAGYLRYWNGPQIGERPTAYILILSPATTTQYHNIDAGIAAQSILLTAVEMGLGGCIIASMDKGAIHAALHLPDDSEIVIAIALGKPAEKVVIEDVIDPDDIEYWRDEDEVHHVPKRSITELVISPQA